MNTSTRRAAIVLIAAGCTLTTVSYGFQHPFMPRAQHQQKEQQHVRMDTSLDMGLRTFIKTKLGRGKDDPNNDKPPANGKMASSTKATTKKKKKKTIKASTTPAAEAESGKPKSITIPSTPTKTKQPVTTTSRATTTQVRSRPSNTARMESSSPRMPTILETESVKDRLNRVRSGQMTDDEKKAFLRTALTAGDSSTSRKPLRQELPDDKESRKRPATSSATPYPKDSLLSNMARGWGSPQNSTGVGDIPLRNWKDGAKMQEQQKKREYFDMVTNPNRFHTYKSSMVTQPGETDLVDPKVHDGLVIPQVGDEMEDVQAAASRVTEEEVLDDIKEYEQTVELSGDLGSRLEQAAHALEEASKKRELERKEKEKWLKQQRLEEKARLAEIQKKQQLEMEKRELELKAKKREEEEAMTREMERRRKQEEARRLELQKAQDAYWAKKLQTEKRSRIQGMTMSQREAFAKHEAQAEEKAIELAAQEAEAIESMEGAKADGAIEAQIDIAAADYISKESVKGPESYDALRERKRRDMEQAKDEQLARLKALNSPLPAPSSRAPPTASPFVPPESFSRRGASELSNLTPPAAAAADIPNSEPTVADMMEEVNTEEVVEVESSAGSGFLSKVLGGRKQDASSTAAASQKQATSSASSKAAPEAKRVVRQKLPLEDTEEAEFDTYDRDGPNRQMSIADAMRTASSGKASGGGDQEQRSKMWGVDMSRIAKSLEDEKN